MSLTQLFTATKAKLAELGWDAEVSFGERQPSRQLNQGPGGANRVVFAPGDESGNLGSYDAPRLPGRNPRSLWDWLVICRVYVWSYDPSAPDDELKQWVAVTELHDAVIEAIHPFCAAGYAPTSPKNVASPNERRLGKEVMFLLEYRQPVIVTPRTRKAPVVGQGGTYLVTPNGEEQGC